jgi:GntP family gluconate:H+ symporter
VHAFLALLFAAVLTGILSGPLPGERRPETPSPQNPASGPAGILTSKPGGKRHLLQAVELTVDGFGKTAGQVGIVIALASIIGLCMVESGAADKIVRRFLAIFGEQRAGQAIVTSGFVISIPIFFESYFMLLFPLARAMRMRTGRHYMLYVLAICCGGTMTHSLVAPHPGPLAMAQNFHLEVGQTMMAGILASIIPVACGWLIISKIAQRIDAPMRDSGGASEEDVKAILAKRDSQLPSFTASLLPVLMPLLLLGSVSIMILLGGVRTYPRLFPMIEFIGDRNVALLIGSAIGMRLLMAARKISFVKASEMISAPLATAGLIILITSAGGAFGFMLENAGVGKTITALASGRDWNLILLAWGLSAVIRVAQGSATVAMITASAIINTVASSGPPLPYHPMYLFLAVGCGSKFLSWMNDAGFWTVSKFSGFTESETLRSWSVLVTSLSIIGLIQCLILSHLLPMKP